MAMFEGALSVAILGGFGIFVYSRFAKKSVKEVLKDIGELLKLPGEEEEQ